MINHTPRTAGRHSTRRGQARAGITLISVLLVTTNGACSSDPATPPVLPPMTTTASSDTSNSGHGPRPVTPPPDKPMDTPATANTVIPEPLVGIWESDSEGDDATRVYQFMPDGRYQFVGLLSYPGPAGTVEFTYHAEGTARVDGDMLLLQPTKVTRTRQDPGDPTGNYTDQPTQASPESRTWSVAGNTLALTGADGQQTYQARST
jgi:hypothetical protein